MTTHSNFFHVHAHSRYSVLDGMSDVPGMVKKAKAMGQPAIALTDHGNMAGTTQLYKAGLAEGIKVFPGCELYIIDPGYTGSLDDSGKAERFHMGMIALNADGYKAMVELVTLSHTRPRFNRFPRLTVDDLITFASDHGDDVAVFTGCYFGYLQQMIVRGEAKKARGWLDMLNNAFPHLYVELQNHGIEHDSDGESDPLNDDDLVYYLCQYAGRFNLPIIASQDSHYLESKNKEAHALMKRMVYGGVEDEFPGDSFHLASGEWVQEHYDTAVWEQCEASYAELLDLHDLKIPALDTYRPRVPTVQKNADRKLDEVVSAALDAYAPRRMGVYQERKKYELGVITQLGQANYLLLWDKFVKWCRDEGICIEARGSANGSLVTFLLGITQVDPIKYNVVFDRFLSIDRIKPPDIDMDIEDVRRGDALRWLNNNFDSTQIGTFGRLGARADDDGGNVVASYRQYLCRELENEHQAELEALKVKHDGKVPKEARMALDATLKVDKNAVYENVQTTQDVRRYFSDDYRPLKQISDMGSVYRSYGVHAGGVLLSGDDLHIDEWVPRMLVASSETTVSQFDMDDVEQWGLLKLDILGQKSLAIMRRCQELMGRANPTDFSWIPEDDAAACKILREGRPDNGIFHFEGKSKAYGGREMGIKNTRDAILATALYMPGAMDTGQKDLYIERRRNPALRNQVQYPHPAFEQFLSPTYGAVVYQEQVLNIMRALGMDIGTINTLFKIVKDSGVGAYERNLVRIKPIREEFDTALLAYDPNADTQASWDWLTGIVAYAFNQAHATGYGIRSYRFAYLKAHYPVQFMSAVLEQNASTKKEPLYQREARRMGIPLLPSHVNKSGLSWTMDPRGKVIRRGLLSIKGVGEAAAQTIVDGAPYESVTDLCERATGRSVTGRKDYLASGALSGTIATLMVNNALADLPA